MSNAMKWDDWNQPWNVITSCMFKRGIRPADSMGGFGPVHEGMHCNFAHGFMCRCGKSNDEVWRENVDQIQEDAECRTQ